MTRNVEKVTVSAGGYDYTEWESISISYAINEAVRTFELNGTERPGQWRFPPGTPITIASNGEIILVGYVNRYMPSGDAWSHTVSISGRSRSQDFVDNSAVHPTGFWEQKTPDQIAKELDLFGVGVVTQVPLQTLPYWQLYQGESPWRTIDRSLRPMGAVQRGLADGSIAITNAMAALAGGGALVEGWNIETFQGEITDDEKHSDYTVKGQQRTGNGKKAIQPVGEWNGGWKARYRPKIIINEQDTDTQRATKRAMYEGLRAEGLSVKATIGTQGWRSDSGAIWDANEIVMVESPVLLKLVQPMLIERVVLTQDGSAGGSGSRSTLTLVDPRAYSGQGGAGSGSGAGGSDPAWNAGWTASSGHPPGGYTGGYPPGGKK